MNDSTNNELEIYTKGFRTGWNNALYSLLDETWQKIKIDEVSGLNIGDAAAYNHALMDVAGYIKKLMQGEQYEKED